MEKIIYNKLVRDKIPEIIEADGKSCNIRMLTDDEYLNMVDAKLGEELKEYLNDHSIEELADLVEVVYAAVAANGYSIEELEQVRKKKVEKRGAFEKKIMLLDVQES